LEILAFIVPASEAAEGLAATIEMLKRIQPEMAPLLGRALAAARLGSPRAAAWERPVSRDRERKVN
jgi:hypothetical protein